MSERQYRRSSGGPAQTRWSVSQEKQLFLPLWFLSRLCEGGASLGCHPQLFAPRLSSGPTQAIDNADLRLHCSSPKRPPTPATFKVNPIAYLPHATYSAGSGASRKCKLPTQACTDPILKCRILEQIAPPTTPPPCAEPSAREDYNCHGKAAEAYGQCTVDLINVTRLTPL